jgi:hypothetical protein
MNRLFAILLGFGASACKPAVDKKAEAVQEMERLETHRLKALEPSTFDPAVPVKPVPPEET